MKYLVASDIHGSRKGIEALLSAIYYEQPDCIILLGDILYGAYDGDEGYVASSLRKFSSKIVAVRGNCDYASDEIELGFPLPQNRDMKIAGHETHLAHRPFYYSFPEGTLLLNGHTHCKSLVEYDGVVYLNPGSVSLPRDGSPSYAVINEKTIQLKELPSFQTISSLAIK